MDESPKQREIKPLEGEPSTIISRGNKITELGEQMIASAALLKSIADGASGQRGLAVEKLQEVVGDCHEELKRAGDRYKPSGPVLVTYGQAVSDLQPLIKTAVSNCETEWERVKVKRSAIFDAQLGYYPAPADDAPEDAKSPEEQRQEAVKDAQDAADDAYEKWKEDADVFDVHYDTWEKAFTLAAESLTDANEGDIKDSRWDNIDGFVAGALEVLKWVGLALAVLGVIVGGPFLAALAAIVAIATLVLTLYAFARGNASTLDLVLAVVGVIPFGHLGKLFSGNKLGFFDEMAGGLLTATRRGEIVGDATVLFGNMGRTGSGLQGILGGVRNGIGAWGAANGVGAPGFAANMISRVLAGRDMADFSDEGLDALSIMSGVWVDGHFKTAFGISDGFFDLFTGDSMLADVDSPSLESPLFGTPTR